MLQIADLKPILAAILPTYALPLNGDHGITHWARVLENGLHVAEQTGADRDVVMLFALFHDCRRISECGDPDHGLRGADFAEELHGRLFQLTKQQFNQLHKACAGHTHERTHPDITIQTCWDADRLDLGRVGITPHPSRLCTHFAKKPKTIKWADGRATFRIVPDFVTTSWNIDLAPET